MVFLLIIEKVGSSGFLNAFRRCFLCFTFFRNMPLIITISSGVTFIISGLAFLIFLIIPQFLSILAAVLISPSFPACFAAYAANVAFDL
jgi:hypothetical protein